MDPKLSQYVFAIYYISLFNISVTLTRTLSVFVIIFSITFIYQYHIFLALVKVLIDTGLCDKNITF